MKELVRTVVYEIFSYINLLIPKKKGQVLLYSNVELTDSCEAMGIYMINNCKYDIKCFTLRNLNQEEKYDGIEYTNSHLKLLFWYFRSEIIIETHTVQIKMRPTKGQYVLQIWHGTPIKRLVHQTHKNFKRNLASFYTNIVFPCPRYKQEFKQLFGAKDEQMLLTGYPRNDLLFSRDHNTFLNTKKYNKVVAWLPTYRNSSSMGTGNRFKNNFPVLNENNVNQLESFLQTHNILLIIKPHPLQDVSYIDSLNSENIKVIHNIDLTMNKEPLYSLLSVTDALLTDFSSVVFDYILLDRPIGYCIDDFEEYKENVGFCIDLEEVLAGPIIRNMDELIAFLQDAVNDFKNDGYRLKREQVRNEFNSFQDNNNSQRCVDAIKRHFNNGLKQ